MRSLSIAATGMLAQQLNVEVISNNIANMQTTGFKRARPEFQDLLYQSARQVGSTSSDTGTVVPSGIQLGLGVRTASVYRITEQGNILGTNSSFDIAIQGKGWFRVQLPSGEDGYTRAGSFQLSPTGEIVTGDGYPVMPGITIPPDAIQVSINATGDVEVKLAGQPAPTNVGTLELVSFPNEGGLESIGNNLVLESASSGSPLAGTPGTDGLGTLLQGFLETSNVNAVAEITNLITAQRAYEMNSKVITTSDEMMATVSQLR
jgi:flagellar basal-body rod protein FlgG